MEGCRGWFDGWRYLVVELGSFGGIFWFWFWDVLLENGCGE